MLGAKASKILAGVFSCYNQAYFWQYLLGLLSPTPSQTSRGRREKREHLGARLIDIQLVPRNGVIRDRQPKKRAAPSCLAYAFVHV